MRVSSFAVARPVYYDRNSTTAGQLAYGTVAPHSPTSRWTYTVPAGKRSYVEVNYVDLARATVATSAATTFAQIYSSNSDASDTVISYTRIFANVAGTYDRSITSAVCILNAGNSLTGQTGDNSTDGTIQYTVGSKYTQFDA